MPEHIAESQRVASDPRSSVWVTANAGSGKTYVLTARVLRLLLQNTHRTLSRDFLIEHAFGKERAPFDRAIDVCISRLRVSLEDDARMPRMIRTVRHAGALAALAAHLLARKRTHFPAVLLVFARAWTLT
eukprot:gene60794-81067_t